MTAAAPRNATPAATAAGAVTHADAQRHGEECAEHWSREVEPEMLQVT